ncbi:MAG: hypothetical protein O4803_02555 [Trichodesmium sp. St15_bin1_1]|nr:hypothetical protein [Trichodesmium sp. St5_bin2_1]MDE5078454.1 hypothetical protein [Trichodesmium sp. St2_bin6]MDE5113178.1 hypothetical protein [Trichodesmium sp. St15_bin1_1]
MSSRNPTEVFGGKIFQGSDRLSREKYLTGNRQKYLGEVLHLKPNA